MLKTFVAVLLANLMSVAIIAAVIDAQASNARTEAALEAANGN